MTNKDLLIKAINIAIKAHEGQSDKSGMPYILHPLRVMERMTTTDEKIVAVLHDVVEDTVISLPLLDELGFPAYIVEAIDCLTKKKNQPHKHYLIELCENEMAMRVKLEDLKDNINILRLESLSERDIKRTKRYHEDVRFIMERL